MTTKTILVRPPKGLADRGRKFWTSTVKRFELTDAELELLTEVCRTLDTLDRLDEVVAVHGATLEGSKGQTVINSAMTEARGQRLVLHRLIAALDLPDGDGASVPTAATLRARTGGTARWKGQRTEASMLRGVGDGSAS